MYRYLNFLTIGNVQMQSLHSTYYNILPFEDHEPTYIPMI